MPDLVAPALSAAIQGSLDCPNGECGYDAGYSTAEIIALVAFGLVALAVLVAFVLLVRWWRG
jgi:hypothetical protein